MADMEIKTEDECRWAEDDYEGPWETSCGNAFEFMVDGPTENGMKFCCYCGKPVLAVPYKLEAEGMRAKPIKCYIGNYDGRRDGMVFAASKREAAKVAGCSVYHFERHWHIHHSLYAVANPKALSLYTRKNDYRSDWQEGICPL